MRRALTQFTHSTRNMKKTFEQIIVSQFAQGHQGDWSTNDRRTKKNPCFSRKLILNMFFLLFHPFSLSDPPEIVKRPANQAVRVGGVASFFCSARGDPVPSIVWRKNGKKVPGTQSRYSVTQIDGLSILRIEPVRAGRDDAPYECVAENGVGDAVSAEATLTVYEGTFSFPKCNRYEALIRPKRCGNAIIALCKQQLHILCLCVQMHCGISLPNYFLRSSAVHAKFQIYMPFSTFFISVDLIKCNENPCVNYEQKKMQVAKCTVPECAHTQIRFEQNTWAVCGNSNTNSRSPAPFRIA